MSVRVVQTVPGGKAQDNLHRADAAWRRLCEAEHMPFKEVVREVRTSLPTGHQEYDVIVLGGEQILELHFSRTSF